MDLQEQLSDRLDGIETQFLKFADEVRAEFSAVRAECSAVRKEFRGESMGIRGELREEIRAGDEETRRQMRMLHEDVIARLTIMQDGHPRARRGVTERPSRRTKR